MKLPAWLKELLTEDDNRTPDIAVIGWAFGIVSFVSLSGYSVVSDPHHHFDMEAFGIGFAAILTAGAAALWGKNKADKINDTKPGA